MNPYILMAFKAAAQVATAMLLKNRKPESVTSTTDVLYIQVVPQHLRRLLDELQYKNGYQEPQYKITPEDDMTFSYIIHNF